jgi:hypothetical protein
MSQGEKMANKILMGPKETAGAKIMAMVTEGNNSESGSKTAGPEQPPGGPH